MLASTREGWTEAGPRNRRRALAAQAAKERAALGDHVGRQPELVFSGLGLLVQHALLHSDRVAIVALYDALLRDEIPRRGAQSRGRVQPYWAARADLLAKLERHDEAAAAYVRAIGLTIDPAARAFLERRLAGMNGTKTTRSP